MKTSETLKEAKRLYDLGLAVHWVKPHSKMPLESGWTTGPRKPWKELETSYRLGMNIGVRTGKASHLPNRGYLACIDTDIKDPAFKSVAKKRLKEILGSFEYPEVESGGGSGSTHHYCATFEPFKMVTLEKHPGKWEICLYSEGRQMVLPPSIHPSGKSYVWKKPPKDPMSFPLFFPGEYLPKEKAASSLARPSSSRLINGGVKIEFEFVWKIDETLDVFSFPQVPEKIRELIARGIWNEKTIEDRSAYLLPATSGLVRAGLNRDEILSVLTDRESYLGECAYDHAQTDSRLRAGKWLWDYTVKRVMAEQDPVLVFSGKPVEHAPELKGEALVAQEEELKDRPEDRGFYTSGARGAKRPEYRALLQVFEKEHPFKTIADMKAVYIFNGTHYEDFTPIEVKAFAEKKFKPEPEDRVRNEFYSKVLANQVMRRSFFTETTEGRINFKNGVLDLNVSDSALIPHHSDFGFRGVLPFQFDPKARCPVFRAWLDGIMVGDPKLVAILQEFMGYIVRGGEYKYHKALWLGGVGRNGKSTFVDVLKALIGAGNFSVISIRSLMGDKFAGADLDGKIANFSEETSPQELADSGPFKNLTGDGDLFVQKKYGDPYTFRNRAKLIMTYNQIPDLKDLSAGMLSRPLIIPFQKIIREQEQDRNIKQKLLVELSGIFNFALEGWNRLEAQGGFTQSEKSDLALQKIKEESCNVYQWVENYIEPLSFNFGDESELKRYRPQELYSIYKKEERYPFKFIDFCRRLNSHPIMENRKNRSREGRFYYFGINVR